LRFGVVEHHSKSNQRAIARLIDFKFVRLAKSTILCQKYIKKEKGEYKK